LWIVEEGLQAICQYFGDVIEHNSIVKIRVQRCIFKAQPGGFLGFIFGFFI